jgi:hypothetical protein
LGFRSRLEADACGIPPFAKKEPRRVDHPAVVAGIVPRALSVHLTPLSAFDRV